MKWRVPKIWTGACWIIGGGASISEQFNIPETLVPNTREEFYAYGEYLTPIFNDHTIGVNLGAFVSDKVEVAFFGDSSTYSDFRAWFDAFGGLKVSCNGKFADPSFRSIYHVYQNSRVGIAKKRDEVCWCAYNSASAAINLAYHLGANPIYLLGIDLIKTNDKVHWHTGYPDRLKTPNRAQRHKLIPRVEPKESTVQEQFNKHTSGYPLIAKEAKKLGLEIINCSPNSRLTCFPKMMVKEVLAKRC